MTQTLYTAQMSCCHPAVDTVVWTVVSIDSCKQRQLWLLSILIMSSGDWEFAELGVTPRLVIVSLLGHMRLGNTWNNYSMGQHGDFGPLQLLIRK